MKYGFPEVAAAMSALLSSGSLATGLQKLIGLPAQSSTIRYRWWAVMDATTFGCSPCLRSLFISWIASTAALVVQCSRTILSFGKSACNLNSAGRNSGSALRTWISLPSPLEVDGFSPWRFKTRPCFCITSKIG
ncbi:hypothetical protein OGAPHI_001892 [Ogataea philodendri]|uniref:Uncharacterized protein n=1 Tax=Ogataea philodendri TaxID=1378263 RepID=A0A9P8P9D4_9ASCO|nr:uncharacterized protein OGAPHI_001892 [Ogataea philodendri]KAH3668138.1 hypothetical protein OGAPHI_001892 [Ogataea philodendri]